MEINKEIEKAYQVIQNGGIILYPTDTVWGIGCDATNAEAVQKIYKLKKTQETQKHDCVDEWRKNDVYYF
jgi:L-threonylcarbamoyladenylate synthase